MKAIEATPNDWAAMWERVHGNREETVAIPAPEDAERVLFGHENWPGTEDRDLWIDILNGKPRLNRETTAENIRQRIILETNVTQKTTRKTDEDEEDELIRAFGAFTFFAGLLCGMALLFLMQIL